MIKEKKKLTGNLNVKQSLSGKLGNAIIFIDPITQEKEITPTRTVQEITPDIGYTGLSKVTVKGYTSNVATKIITKNGTYKASDDDLDGYSEVEVETSGVDINDYYLTSGNYSEINSYIKKVPLIDTSNVTNMNRMFQQCDSLTTIPQLDTSKVTNMSYMFYNCTSLTTIPLINTGNVTNLWSMFNSCYSLTTIPQLDTSNVISMPNMLWHCDLLTTIPQLDLSKVTNVEQAFMWCFALTTLGGFQNLGMAYDTTPSANYRNYRLELSTSSKLTHDSLMNVINGLYDIKTKGCNPQQLILGSVNLAKLTAEEIAIATNKGWTVS